MQTVQKLLNSVAVVLALLSLVTVVSEAQAYCDTNDCTSTVPVAPYFCGVGWCTGTFCTDDCFMGTITFTCRCAKGPGPW